VSLPLDRSAYSHLLADLRSTAGATAASAKQPTAPAQRSSA
jgi:hypothetical protein